MTKAHKSTGNKSEKRTSPVPLLVSAPYRVRETASSSWAECGRGKVKEDNRVTTASQQCPNSVTTVLQQCHNSVTTVSQQCPNSVPTVLQQCHNSVTTVSQQCPNSVPTVSQQCYNSVTTVSRDTASNSWAACRRWG
jgi:hypothetical protein